MTISFCFGAHPSTLKNNQVSQFSTQLVHSLHANNGKLSMQEQHKMPLPSTSFEEEDRNVWVLPSWEWTR